MKFNNKDIFIGRNVSLGKNVKIGDRTYILDNVQIGDNTIISNDCTIGEPLQTYYSTSNYVNPPTTIGPNTIIRSNTIIYAGNLIGSFSSLGHRALIRENCKIGRNCSIGNGTELHGDCTLGDYVRVHSNADLASVTVGNHVWIYTGSRFMNDRNPPSDNLRGAIIGDYSIIAVNAMLLSGVELGQHCLVGAGAFVNKSYGDYAFLSGLPAKLICDVRDLRSKQGVELFPWPKRFGRGMPWQDIGYEKWLNYNE